MYHPPYPLIASSPSTTAKLFLKAVTRRWRLILLVTLLVSVAVTASVYLRRPTYESRAGLVINIERFNVSTSRADARQNMAVLTTVEAVTSQSEAIRSRDLIEEVVRDLDPSVFDGPPPSHPVSRFIVELKSSVGTFVSDMIRAAHLLPARNEFYEHVQIVERGLDISTVRQAQVIRLSYQADSAATAKTVLGKIIEVYARRTAGRGVDSKEYAGLSREANRFRSELDVAEQELAGLRTRYGIADLATEKQTVSDRLNRLTAAIESRPLPADTGAVEKRASRDVRPLVDAPSAGDETNRPTGGSSTGQIGQLRAQLNALVVERASLDTMFAAGHPKVVSLDRQIGKVEELLKQQTAAVTDAIEANRGRLKELLGIEPQFMRLSRNVRILSDTYEIYRKAASDRQIMGEQEARVQLQTIDPPTLPYRPNGASRAVVVAAGPGIGLAVGIALALLASFLEGDLGLTKRMSETDQAAA